LFVLTKLAWYVVGREPGPTKNFCPEPESHKNEAASKQCITLENQKPVYPDDAQADGEKGHAGQHTEQKEQEDSLRRLHLEQQQKIRVE
jgi:hypothetical protein